jgi:hypothetical protein
MDTQEARIAKVECDMAALNAEAADLRGEVARVVSLAERVSDHNAEMKELLRAIHGHVGEDIQASIEDVLGQQPGWVAV